VTDLPFESADDVVPDYDVPTSPDDRGEEITWANAPFDATSHDIDNYPEDYNLAEAEEH
jgi:hypothetical protein